MRDNKRLKLTTFDQPNYYYHAKINNIIEIL
jgi:hypothetical protein